MLFCGECRDAGRTSRLLYSRNTGNGGVYEYLICAAHQRRLCSTPGARVDQLEAEIIPVIAAERIATDDLENMQEAVTKSVDNILAQDRNAKTQLRKQLNKLEAQEERLIELAATGALPMSKIRERIEKTALQRSAIEEKLEFTAERLRYSADAALAFLQLLADPGRLYSGASDAVRRNLLTAFFTRLVVYVTDDGIKVESVRNDTNNSLRELNGRIRLARENHQFEKTKTPRTSARSSVSTESRTGSLDHGLSNYDLAGIAELCSNHWELPFTPDELRNLAVLGDRGGDEEVVPEYQAHELSRHLGAAKVAELSRRAAAGESARSLAREVGVANSALVRMLREQGVSIHRRKVGEEEERALANAYEAGQTVAELEKSFKLSHGAVLRALHRAGVEMRAKAPRPTRT